MSSAIGTVPPLGERIKVQVSSMVRLVMMQRVASACIIIGAACIAAATLLALIPIIGEAGALLFIGTIATGFATGILMYTRKKT